MAVKSIIDIDVNDEQFKDFTKLFQKYKDAVEKLPNSWSKSGDEISATSKDFVTMTSALMSQLELVKKQEVAQEKLNQRVKSTDSSMGKLYKTTSMVLSSVKDVATSLLKWGTITTAVSGLVGFGGLFGYANLAHTASQNRSSALTLGVSPAQKQAADITYARIPGAGGIMENLANIQGDISKQYLLTQRLGLNPEDVRNKNAADLLPKTLLQLRQRFMAIPQSQQNILAPALGLTDIASISQLRALSGMSEEEVSGLSKQYEKRKESIGGTSEIDRRYQDFIARLETTGKAIQNTLIDKLVPLAEPLSHLGESIGNLFKSALGSKEFSQGIDSFAKWIDEFAKTFDKESMKKSLQDFITALGDTVKGLAKFVEQVIAFTIWIDSWFKDRHETGTEPNLFVPGLESNPFLPPSLRKPVSYNYNDLNPNNLYKVSSDGGEPSTSFFGYERKRNLPFGLLSAVMRTESNGRLNAVSKVGAMGPFQFMPKTAQRFGLSNPFNLEESAEAASKYFEILLGMFGGNLDMALAGYNAGEGRVKKEIRKHGSYWKKHIPQETAEYIEKVKSGMGSMAFNAEPGQGVSIRIINPTGGNIVQSVAGLNRI